MTKLKVKTGDLVKVIAGNHKGEQGKIVRVFSDKNKAIVEGINVVSKHNKPTTENPQGGIFKKEAPIHISNIALVDPKTKEATRVGYRMEGDKKVRFAKKSNQVIK